MSTFKNYLYTQVDSGSFLSASYVGGYPFERGFFINKDDLKNLASSKTIQSPFGIHENENIEFCLYDAKSNIVKHKTISQSGSFQSITRSFYDIYGKNQGYNYELYTGDFLSLRGSVQFTSSLVAASVPSGSMPLNVRSDELVISPVNDLQVEGLQNGSYSISYTLLKDLVGSNIDGNKLMIKGISPDRTEILVIPQYARSDKTHSKLINDFYTFGNKSFKIKYISDSISDNLKNPMLPQAFDTFSKKNEDLVKELKYVYGFVDDTSLLNFVVSMFDSIKNQYENTIYASYENSIKFQELDDFYNNVCSYVIDKSLKGLNSDLPPKFSDNYILYVAFFYNIYDSVLGLNKIESDYKSRYYGYLRNYINIGKGKLIPILTWEYANISGRVEPDQNYPIVIKLANELDDSIKVDSFIWISNLISSPRIFNVTLYQPSTLVTKKLRGPNFRIKTENSGESTKAYSFDELVSSGSAVTQKLLNYINQNYFDVNLNIDYRYLENFVHFSTAKDRIYSYDEKVNQISQAESEIQRLDTYISQSYNIYYETEKLKYIDDINLIKSNLDGYERFLYYSPLESGSSWRDIHWVSSSIYDKFNDHSLINNTPREIAEQIDGEEYKKFLSMIGHHFDLIYSYIEHLPSVSFAENDPTIGVAQNMVYHLLSSFGFDAYSGYDNQDLWLSVFGDSPETTADNMLASGSLESISGQDRTKTVWRRILNNLSYLVKTKGTEESIRALMSCYGIPKYLFKIREYGGIEYTTDLTQDSLFIFDNNNYFARFSGSAEYIKSPWYEDTQTIEFKVAFNPYETSGDGTNFRLATCDSNWAVGFIRETGSWARGYFTITDSGSNVRTMVTDKLPIFNGDVFSVMLRKNDINPRFDIPISASSYDLDLVPTMYEMYVKRAEDERFVFDVSSSMVLSGSHNTYFRSGSNIYFGNYLVSNQPDNFFGNLDQIRLWGNALSIERFNNHAMFVEAYDTDNPYSTINDLFIKVDFDTPISLYTTSSYVSIPNSSYNQDRIEFVEAYNFASSSEYPYNFTLYENRETVKIPNFGSSKFRSNKIRIETQELVAPLSPYSRSTLKSRDRQPCDTNGLGVFFSPVELIDMDVLRFLGNYDLGDFIGDPADLYKKNYDKFNTFKDVYFKHGGGHIDFQAYINLVKSYFDKSMFKHLNHLVPARSNFKSGLLIEPSLLERNKIQVKHTEREIHNNINTQINITDIYSAEYVQVHTSSITVFDKPFTSRNNNYFSQLYAPLDEWYYQIYTDSNGITTRTIDSGSTSVYYYKAEILKEKKTYQLANEQGDYTTFSSSFNKINLIPLGQSFTGSADNVPLSPGAKLLKGYPTGHHKFKRDIFGRSSKQTQYTTVDETGLLNNTLPYEINSVDRTVIKVLGNQTSTILGSS